jgi:hypothetical protein
MAKLKTVIDSPISSVDGSPMPSWMKNFKMPDQPPGLTNTSGLDSDDGGDSDAKEVISPVKLMSQSTIPRGKAGDPPESPLIVGPASASLPDDRDLEGSDFPSKSKVRRRLGAPLEEEHSVPASKQLVSSSTVPLVLPERFPPTKKILLEHETHGNDNDREDLALTDFSGDSGAIGRLLLVGAPGARQLQIDLKGVLYNANIVPSPVSMAIVNFSGSNEAKIETLVSEYVQLREDPRFLEIRKSAVCGFLTEDEDGDEAAMAYHDNGEGTAQPNGAHGKLTKNGKQKKGTTFAKSKKVAGHSKVTSTAAGGRKAGRGTRGLKRKGRGR